MFPTFETAVYIQCDKAVLQAYLMIQHTPPADAAMMSARKHHKHVQPCILSPAFLSLSSSHIRSLILLTMYTKTYFFTCVLLTFPHAVRLDFIISTLFHTFLMPAVFVVSRPRAGKSELFLHLKRVRLDQALTGLSIHLSDVSTGNVSPE